MLGIGGARLESVAGRLQEQVLVCMHAAMSVRTHDACRRIANPGLLSRILKGTCMPVITNKNDPEAGRQAPTAA